MPWVLKGLIFNTEGLRSWSRSHAQVPTPLPMGDRIRVYYATRDDSGRSRTSFVEVDAQNPAKVLYDHPQPVMELGDLGTYDEDGVMVGSVIRDGEKVRMYYTGWTRGGGSVPYRVSCGMAVSEDGGITFQRPFHGPVVDRAPFEPYMTLTPYVLRQRQRWLMWYGSGLRWVDIDGIKEPIYVIKLAESRDGVVWSQRNLVCIPQTHPLEANCRSTVLYDRGRYEMWFSYRHSLHFRGGTGSYRIGHATSSDGCTWQRQQDPEGLQPSGFGWNAAMMAYPAVVPLGKRRLMFHNGDGFGTTGFGYSEWTE